MNYKNSPLAEQRVDVGYKMVTVAEGLRGLALSG